MRAYESMGVVLAVLSTVAGLGCGGHGRFALRAPVLKDDDDRPFAKAPAVDEESDIANAADVILLRPFSHAFLFEVSGEARNVNSLDEVPDSTWFQNRSAAPAALERGPCPAADPVPPFTVKSSKVGGTTPGFVVKDSTGQKYMLKLDADGPRQPEISTASDAITSRLYWAVGFNAPCNQVLNVPLGAIVVDEKSKETLPKGKEIPLTAARLAEVLRRATPGPGGTLRVSTSRFISGKAIGTWRTEGTRKDDPNDVIPHEDRRDLRGERFLAAWVNHWDSRGPNTFDTFVPAKGGGYVLHYFLDFSDSLGGAIMRTEWAEPRAGFTTVSNVPQIATDVAGFGFIRRPWDDVRVDPRFPNLGFYDVAHFDPQRFSPQTPLVRWARADSADLGWMARRLARMSNAHVRVAVQSGKLTNPAEEARLQEILIGRRDRILRTTFARSASLADLAMEGGERLCATDLLVSSGLAGPLDARYLTDFREGADLTKSRNAAFVGTPDVRGRLCVDLPPHFAPAGALDDAAERYAVLEIVRKEGRSETKLLVHFYDLGPQRGYAMVGVERPG